MTIASGAVEISGLRGAAALRARIGERMTAALEPIKLEPVSARIAFFDDNGPKGGRAMRCALTVRLPYRPSIRVERSAVTPRLAFDAAIAVLERQLERYYERERENKRHPKKYFAAGRAVAGETARPPKRTRRA